MVMRRSSVVWVGLIVLAGVFVFASQPVASAGTPDREMLQGVWSTRFVNPQGQTCAIRADFQPNGSLEVWGWVGTEPTSPVRDVWSYADGVLRFRAVLRSQSGGHEVGSIDVDGRVEWMSANQFIVRDPFGLPLTWNRFPAHGG
jgi:hypothetical protein